MSLGACLSGRHVGEYYFNDRNTEAARNPAHFVADAKAGWRFKALGPLAEAELSLAINNLFDREYREQQYDVTGNSPASFPLCARC